MRREHEFARTNQTDGGSASRLEWAVQRREKIPRPRAGNAFNSLSIPFCEQCVQWESNRSGPEPAQPRPERARSIVVQPGSAPHSPQLATPAPADNVEKTRHSSDIRFCCHSCPRSPPVSGPCILAEVALMTCSSRGECTLFGDRAIKTGLTPARVSGEYAAAADVKIEHSGRHR